MKIKKMPETNRYILLIEKNENIIATLEKVAQQEKIGMAKFNIIGSITDVILGYVPHNGTDYQWTTFSDQYELISANGNITWDQASNKPIIHTHVSVGNHDFNTISGHLKEAKVALLAEVIIDIVSDEKIYKALEPTIGFKLWNI